MERRIPGTAPEPVAKTGEGRASPTPIPGRTMLDHAPRLTLLVTIATNIAKSRYGVTGRVCAPTIANGATMAGTLPVARAVDDPELADRIPTASRIRATSRHASNGD